MDYFRRSALRIYLLLAATEGLISLAVSLRVESDPENAWLLGYSKARLLMAALILSITVALILLAWGWQRLLRLREKTEGAVQQWINRNWAIAVVLIFTGVVIGALYYGILISTKGTDAFVMGRLRRLTPMLAWGGLMGVQAVIALPLLRFGREIARTRLSLPSWRLVIDDTKRTILGLRRLLGRTRWLLAGAVMLYPVWALLYAQPDDGFPNLFPLLSIFVFTTLALGLLLGGDTRKVVKWPALLAALITFGAVFAMAKLLTFVTDHPFSLYWSEGNRAWDYSVLYAHDLYRYPAREPIEAYIDVVRQSLWGLPFLLPKVTFLGLRLWNAFLFSVPYMLLGWMAIRPRRWALPEWFVFGVWTFVFLNNGPIYTPLVLAAVLVVASRRSPLWVAFSLVFLAGAYAQLARWTWLLAPAMWAGMITIAQPSVEGRELDRKDWVRAIVLIGAGVLGGYVIPRGWPALQVFLQSSGTPNSEEMRAILQQLTLQTQTAPTQGQALLWYRLWPNATYPPGIVIGGALVTAPLIAALIYLVRRDHWHLNRWQIVVIGGALAASLAVGLVASVKIGGGTNLHNLDMYMVGLVLTASLAWEAGLHHKLSELLRDSAWMRAFLIVMVAVQAIMPMIDAEPLVLPPKEKTAHALDFIRHATACAEEHGEVLFMDQRQLLTFGYVTDVTLIPEYEKKKVLDKALDGDRAYFAEFYEDLANQRFSLIVTERQAIRIKENVQSLAAENNTWVKWVTLPLFEHYESIANFKLVGVELFMPIGRSFDCP